MAQVIFKDGTVKEIHKSALQGFIAKYKMDIITYKIIK